MRKLVWFALGFAAACFLCAYFYATWLSWVAIGGLTAGVVCGILSRKAKLFRLLFAIFLGLSVGLGWFAGYNALYLQNARDCRDSVKEMELVVSDFSTETNYGCVCKATTVLEGKTYSVWTYLNDVPSVSPGDVIRGAFLLRFTADLDADIPSQHRGKGLFLIASQRGEAVIEKGQSLRWYHYPSLWRRDLKRIIDASFAQDASGFAKALLLGDREGIDYQTETSFRISGISHVIAVSGLHVSILFGLIYFVTLRKRFLTALLGIPAVLIFAAVAGFTPSVVRASLMHILMMLALLFEKEYDPPTALAFAAQVILAVNPLTVSSVSFQLSVACLAGIFLFSTSVRGWLTDKKRLGRWKSKTWKGRLANWFSVSVSITLGAMVFTTPLCAYYFGAVSLVGPLTNLLVLWVVTFVFYGVMLVCAVGLISLPVAGWIAWCMAWPIRYILLVCKVLSAFPLAAVYTTSEYIVAWLVFCYVLLVIFLCRRKKPVMTFACTAVIALCVALGFSWAEGFQKESIVQVLDVGQGQCIILRSEGKTFVVDCGGSYADAASDNAADTLISQGIFETDGVILTHYDADHSGGVAGLLSRVDTQLVLLPHTLDENGVGETVADATDGTVHYIHEDTEIAYGNTKLTLFAPESYNSGNESSLCVLFQTEKCDILITGDRGAAGEAILLRHHDLPEVDILVVGHHGAKDAASQQLLQEVRPVTAVVSAGKNNRYGHPAQEVLDRLSKYGCQVFRTDLDGTLIFRGGK